MRAPITLGKPQQELDESEQGEQTSAFLYDGFFTPQGSVYEREGVTFLVDCGENFPIDGVYESVAGTVYKACNGKLWTIASNGAKTEITPADGAKLMATAGRQVRFMEDGSHVWFVDGTHAFYVNAGTYIRNDDIVSGATHIAYVKGFLVTNGLLSGGVSGDTTFCLKEDNGTYLTAKYGAYNNEGLPDGVNALIWKGDLLYAFGPKSLEISWATGILANPMALVDSGFIGKGCANGDAVAIVGDSIIFPSLVSGKLKIMMIGPDKSLVEISKPIQKILDGAQNIATDLFAWEIPLNGNPGYYLRTLQDGFYQTLVYDVSSGLWTEYTYGGFDPWLMNCGVYVQAWNKFLIGDSAATGYLYTHEGLDDDGEPIQFEAHSGRISRGTNQRKFCKRLDVQVNRGATSDPDVAATARLYWRDQLGAWSTARTLNLGVHGDLDANTQRETMLGNYLDRIWSIVYSGSDCRCIISGLFEVFTVENG